METNTVIEQLNRENWIINTINNISKNTLSNDDILDLSQELYLRILTSKTTSDTIERISNIQEVKYYLTRAIALELFSETSYFNQKYGRWNKKRAETDKLEYIKYYDADSGTIFTGNTSKINDNLTDEQLFI